MLRDTVGPCSILQEIRGVPVDEHTAATGALVAVSPAGRGKELEEDKNMTARNVCGALMAIALTCGLSVVAPADAQTRDASLLPPEESGVITVVGCFQLGGKNGDKYVLANPRIGPIAGVPDATCRVAANEHALELEHTDKFGINESMLGRWIEVNGRLEKETSDNPDNLREMHVRSFRMMPVLPPPVEVAQAPVTQAPAVPYVFDQQPYTPPAATMARVDEPAALPRTATPLPAIGLLGLLSLGGGLALRLLR
jgi:hypothetical protein